MNTKSYLTPTRKYKSLISSSHSIYRVVNSTLEVKDLVGRLSKLISQVFNASSCQITLIDPGKKYSLLKCFSSNKKRYLDERKTLITDNTERKIINSCSTIIHNNFLGLPLVHEDVIGLIILKRNKQMPAFERTDQEMIMTLLEQAIMGIKNLQLYEEQQKIVLGSIKSLVSLLDMRVPQEYTHSAYFSHLVVAIAHEMHLDEKQVQSLKYASLLHDAGKVDIPLKILTKTTKLTPKEYGIIQRHPMKGAQILRPLQILKPVVPIIMHHHEKYNGTGYPSRLKKNQIPLGARIMAVADAFEAMVYGRPYRERKDISSAIKEIKKKSGTQFDPKVVDAFLRTVKKISLKKYLHNN